MQRKEFEILTAMERATEPCTQRGLAAVTGLSLGSVNKAVRNMTEYGWVSGNRITDSGFEALESYRVKRAVFLAAGFGSRMAPITFNTPKPLVRINGVRMIDTVLDAVTAVGIRDIVIARGYLGEQFDQLLCKYPNIRLVENPMYNEANNISTVMCVRYLFPNAYVTESDFVVHNPAVFRKYEYTSNYLGFPVEVTDDWCVRTDANGIITEECIGGKNCHQLIGISYWNEQDGHRMASDIESVFHSPGGRERDWTQVHHWFIKRNTTVWRSAPATLTMWWRSIPSMSSSGSIKPMLSDGISQHAASKLCKETLCMKN